MDTDLELLTRLRNGDEEAFVMFVARYQQPMLHLARTYVPSRAVAEEAVQDTWMGVVKGIERFEGRSAFKTWLFRILINRARSAGSREQRHAAIEPHHAVDPIRFDTNGQWADPVERWTEDSEDRLEAATGGRPSNPASRTYLRANVRSSCCATWKDSPVTRCAICSKSVLAISGSCYTGAGLACARSSKLK